MKNLSCAPLALILVGLLTLVPPPKLTAQKIDFSFGARAGILLNKASSDSFTRNESQRYALGPVIEVGFLQHFAIEFAPTYRRFGATYAFDNSTSTGNVVLPPGSSFALRGLGRVSGYNWDLPLIGKYYFANKQAKLRPFFGYGVAGTRAPRSFSNQQTQIDGAGIQTTTKTSGQYSSFRYGHTASAGLRYKVGRFDLVPEVRYLQDRSAFPPASTKNRFEFFLGFRF